MHLYGWAVGADTAGVMRSLTHHMGFPPAERWLPLQSTAASGILPQWRSGWVVDPPEPGDEWVHVALPAQMVKDELGPYALVPEQGLATVGDPDHVRRTEDGSLRIGVPRFFETVTDHWSFARDWLGLQAIRG